MFRTIFIIILLEMVIVMSPNTQNVQNTKIPGVKAWNDLMSKIEQLPLQQRPALVESFLASQGQFVPIIGNEQAIFIFYGNAKEVRIAGDFNNWQPTAEMRRIEGTNLWHKSLYVKNDARLEYKLVVDGNWGIDTLNPRISEGGYGKNSDLWMAEYQPPSWLNAPIPEQKGSIEKFYFKSDILANSRLVQIYLPYNYNKDNSYPFFLVHDGNDYLRFTQLDRLADLLISQNKLKPCIIAFVDPVERSVEYECDEKYLAFTRDELLPHLAANYAISKNPQERCLVGASMGGIVSLYLAHQLHNSFQRIISQSGAFFFEGEPNRRIFQFMATMDYERFRDSKIWLDCGNIGDLEMMLLQGNTVLKERLEQNKILHHCVLVNEAHNWKSWQKRLESALLYIFN